MPKGKNCAERLIEHFKEGDGDRGAMMRAARALQTYRQMVSNWKAQGHIPASWAHKVEIATDGAVTAASVLEEHDRKFPKQKIPHPYAMG